MTLISSAKPFGRSVEVDANQYAAKYSWESVADCIVYCNPSQEDLRSPKTQFVELDDFPIIFELATLASMSSDWVAILNADIVIGSRLPEIIEKLNEIQFNAATSWRFNFNPEVGILSAEAQPSDSGLDFFMALPEVWKGVVEKVPKDLRIGSQLWDTWLLSYFSTFCCQTYADITQARVVFHPRHESRCYGPAPKTPELWSWPVQSPLKIS
jgi:hypothetical protein